MPSAGHFPDASKEEEDPSSRIVEGEPAGKKPKRSRGRQQWLTMLAMLALLTSPIALFLAGHFMAGSAVGRERLVNGAYGSGGDSFGRCLQHMRTPESLQSATQDWAEHSYQPQPGSAAHHISEELACIVIAANRESSGLLNMLATAYLHLHRPVASMAAHVGASISARLHIVTAPVSTGAQSIVRQLEKLCPACMVPVRSAIVAYSSLSLQHMLRLNSPAALGSELHAAERLSSWAPAMPVSFLRAGLRLVPQPIRAAGCDAWARASTWVHVCATWAPSKAPKLTPLHGAVYLAHDGANIALHSLKQMAGCTCRVAEYASTCLRGAGPKLASVWHASRALLRFSHLAAMTDDEREAYLASKSARQDPAAPKHVTAQAVGRLGWLGNLWAGKSSPSLQAADLTETHSSMVPDTAPGAASQGASDSAAAPSLEATQQATPEESTQPVKIPGISHIQSEGGGTIMWDGQAGQVGQPGQPQMADAEAKGVTGLQHVQTAGGGMITWTGQAEQGISEAQEAPQPAQGPDLKEAPTLSHVQTGTGGSITRKGQPSEREINQSTAAQGVVSSSRADLLPSCPWIIRGNHQSLMCLCSLPWTSTALLWHRELMCMLQRSVKRGTLMGHSRHLGSATLPAGQLRWKQFRAATLMHLAAWECAAPKPHARTEQRARRQAQMTKRWTQ